MIKTRFILINPSHAGNVGATARAMYVMGFTDLVLVAPRWADVLEQQETIDRASGANLVLQQARVVADLDAALDGMTHLCATAMTARDFGPPTYRPRQHFSALIKQWQAEDAAGSQHGLAILMGSERYGMLNQDVYRSHACLQIPTNPDYGSLNLAAAVQLLAYEWRLALNEMPDAKQLTTSATINPAEQALADATQVAQMVQHLEQALEAIEFLDPKKPKKLVPRLMQMFNRARLRTEEVNIWRGIAKKIIIKANRS